MITVNLKDLYYWCKEDVFVEITEEMLEAMKATDRQESAYKRCTYLYKGHYTLDMGNSYVNMSFQQYIFSNTLSNYYRRHKHTSP
ncbi:hypothetical protein [Ruminiclostridium cellobioparum]|uniref:Uncharacterized protein n=1 Tax=Ruminiclostridium cellobioparum subsp. termitidis CT1112 TaxID=1195236 RepID=S0FJB3_RUMCE|nr:hypothetical protein [Ruminiclostridium cellobioparum]EMS72210.1 hypothetical protein CTER_1885 [Ruminiclostridium cellobioparum subsp. termitidis CT1112]